MWEITWFIDIMSNDNSVDSCQLYSFQLKQIHLQNA